MICMFLCIIYLAGQMKKYESQSLFMSMMFVYQIVCYAEVIISYTFVSYIQLVIIGKCCIQALSIYIYMEP